MYRSPKLAGPDLMRDESLSSRVVLGSTGRAMEAEGEKLREYRNYSRLSDWCYRMIKRWLCYALQFTPRDDSGHRLAWTWVLQRSPTRSIQRMHAVVFLFILWYSTWHVSPIPACMSFAELLRLVHEHIAPIVSLWHDHDHCESLKPGRGKSSILTVCPANAKALSVFRGMARVVCSMQHGKFLLRRWFSKMSDTASNILWPPIHSPLEWVVRWKPFITFVYRSENYWG